MLLLSFPRYNHSKNSKNGRIELGMFTILLIVLSSTQQTSQWLNLKWTPAETQWKCEHLSWTCEYGRGEGWWETHISTHSYIRKQDLQDDKRIIWILHNPLCIFLVPLLSSKYVMCIYYNSNKEFNNGRNENK